jgi:phage gpG-like protein
MRPWHNELLVSDAYKRLIGRDFATLERTEAERAKTKGTKYEGGTGAHLKDSFVYEIGEDSASMTNTAPYADKHQFGNGVPYRPYYPIVKDGSRLMPFAEARQLEIVDEHFKT